MKPYSTLVGKAARRHVAGARRRRGIGARAYVTLDPEEFYSRVCDGFRRSANGWASACCPFHSDESPSLAINLESGRYFCRSPHRGAKGGDIVSFVMRREGLSYGEALRWIEENL